MQSSIVRWFAQLKVFLKRWRRNGGKTPTQPDRSLVCLPPPATASVTPVPVAEPCLEFAS
jgi:hypothetical protein